MWRGCEQEQERIIPNNGVASLLLRVNTKFFVRSFLKINFSPIFGGEVMGEILNVPPPSWQEAVTGLHRRRLLLLASQALAGMYKKALQANVEDI